MTDKSIKIPVVSVVMATFNESADIIRLAIESILEQTLTDLELIIIDDSTDSVTIKTIDELEIDRFEHLSNAFIHELSSCDFVSKRQNIVMIGNPGTGKTHLSIALGIKACIQGMNVKFFTAANLSNELIEAQEYKNLIKLEKQLAKVDLLIIDELSYLTFNRHQSELLFKVIADRAERRSVIVSTNLKFSDWVNMFENTTMVTALIDRLTFRSHVLNMNSDHPYREEHSGIKDN